MSDKYKITVYHDGTALLEEKVEDWNWWGFARQHWVPRGLYASEQMAKDAMRKRIPPTVVHKVTGYDERGDHHFEW